MGESRLNGDSKVPRITLPITFTIGKGCSVLIVSSAGAPTVGTAALGNIFKYFPPMGAFGLPMDKT